jgi:hypothetical protein
MTCKDFTGASQEDIDKYLSSEAVRMFKVERLRWKDLGLRWMMKLGASRICQWVSVGNWFDEECTAWITSGVTI